MELMINLFINIIQSFLFIYFLIKCFGVKEIGIGKKSIYAIGFFVTLIYLELPALFSEGNNALSYILIAMLFCLIFLRGQLIEKVLYSTLLVAVRIYTTILVGSILGFIQRMNYIEMRDLGGNLAYIAMVCIQLILGGILYILAKYKDRVRGVFHVKYTFVYVVIPIISVVLCTAVLEMFHSRVVHKNEQILIIMLGILLLNMLVMHLYLGQHRYYNQVLENTLQLNSYEQYQLNLREIKRSYQETEKNRHEIKRVMQMTMSLIENGNSGEAIAYLKAFEDTRIKETKKQILIDHLVLNATLTQKMEICRGVNMKKLIVTVSILTILFNIFFFLHISNSTIENWLLDKTTIFLDINISDQKKTKSEILDIIQHFSDENNVEIVQYSFLSADKIDIYSTKKNEYREILFIPKFVFNRDIQVHDFDKILDVGLKNYLYIDTDDESLLKKLSETLLDECTLHYLKATNVNATSSIHWFLKDMDNNSLPILCFFSFYVLVNYILPLLNDEQKIFHISIVGIYKCSNIL